MLPKSNISIKIKEVKQPSKTYKLDLLNKRIVGYVDGIEAVRQSVNKILETERYKHCIYSWDYGFEGRSLIGKETDFVKVAIKRKIKEALLADDRILGIYNIGVAGKGDSITCSFTVDSKEGSFDMSYQLNS